MNWIRRLMAKGYTAKGLRAVRGMLAEQLWKSGPIHEGLREAILDGEDAKLLLARAAQWMDISKRLRHRDATVLRYVAAFLLATAAKVEEEEERARVERAKQ